MQDNTVSGVAAQKPKAKTNRLFAGRSVIMTDIENITKENVIQVLKESLCAHAINAADTDYLYKYYKGYQPILQRTKDVRPEICNKIVENRANEIVSFKSGYLMGEPIQYVSRGEQEISKEIIRLNDFVESEDKAVKDKELADWFHICGTAYRMILPTPSDSENEDSPFEIFTLDPRTSFVVYMNDLRKCPVMGVTFVLKRNKQIVYSIYTSDRYFEIENDKVTVEKPNPIGVPIIEYPANIARIGEFETVLTLLDALNLVASNRMDGVEQFIQALMLFHNVKIDDELFKRLQELGALAYTDVDTQTKGEVKYLTSELNQAQTQSLVNYLYETILTICGLPNRNGGSSTSDTGAAVHMRDGWEAAEARAKNSELMFKKSEKRFLRKVLHICETIDGLKLRIPQIEIRFTRRNYENIAAKANVLTMMLSNDKIHPKLAFSHCGMFVDSEIAYTESMEWIEAQEGKHERDNSQSGLEGDSDNTANPSEGEQRGDTPEKRRDSNSGSNRKN